MDPLPGTDTEQMHESKKSTHDEHVGIGRVTKRVDKHLRGALTLAVLGKENTELQLQKTGWLQEGSCPITNSLRRAKEKV